MQMIDNSIILLLIVLAFVAGKRIADKYNQRRISELEYQLRLYAAEKGLAYVAPPVEPMPIGKDFMDKLKGYGRATQAIRKSKQSESDGASA